MNEWNDLYHVIPLATDNKRHDAFRSSIWVKVKSSYKIERKLVVVVIIFSFPPAIHGDNLKITVYWYRLHTSWK